jgi:hypothetical protein
MLGRGDTREALGSGAVDADFWALVCEDEEWLRAEFDAIVSEPAETPAVPSGRLAVVGAERSRRLQRHRAGPARRPPVATWPGWTGQRERSPPVRAGRSLRTAPSMPPGRLMKGW